MISPPARGSISPNLIARCIHSRKRIYSPNLIARCIHALSCSNNTRSAFQNVNIIRHRRIEQKLLAVMLLSRTALGKDVGCTLKMSYLLPTTTSGTGQGLTARVSGWSRPSLAYVFFFSSSANVGSPLAMSRTQTFTQACL